jgi:invasion protein IalB
VFGSIAKHQLPEHDNCVAINAESERLFDCGLFFFSFAFSLLIGEDPSTQAYDQKTMRVHLAMCFQVGELAQFPVNASVLPMQHEGSCRTVLSL